MGGATRERPAILCFGLVIELDDACRREFTTEHSLGSSWMQQGVPHHFGWYPGPITGTRPLRSSSCSRLICTQVPCYISQAIMDTYGNWFILQLRETVPTHLPVPLHFLRRQAVSFCQIELPLHT